MADAFGPIKPDPASDFFVFDFTYQIGGGGASITAANWQVTVDGGSAGKDPTPGARLLAPPTFSSTKTSALLGKMIDGVIYGVASEVVLSDSRTLTDHATLLCAASDPGAYMTPTQFRLNFPAFSDTGRFPDTEVQFWINQAYAPPNTTPAINKYRWGQYYELGLQLFVAHNLAVEDMMVQRAGPPGMGTGPGGMYGFTPLTGSGVAASKSVNGVSISYDNQFGMEENAGWWGLSPWGSQFLYYLRLAGAAPIQL